MRFIRTLSGRLPEKSTHRVRLLLACLLVLFSAPVVADAASYTPPGAEPSGGAATADIAASNVTFVSTQGTSTQQGAGVFAINTSSKGVVWSYTDCPEKCYDVDPVTNSTVLFSAKTTANKPWEIGTNTSYNWKAIHVNWRTGEVIRQFSIPIETHDMDYLGNGTYIIANKILHDGAEEKWVSEAKKKGLIDESRETHSHLIYVYDAKRDEITWEYRFANHYPESAGDGYEEDYTHLNDVDVVQNGSAILASPREFDRVLLINRTTKETEWELGSEDEYATLHEQHNPTLLSSDPPTVLVADSENDRVVEYRKNDSSWDLVWVYRDGLNWPRDADRLPNGNTLIVDTANDRVIEVTPDKEAVWSKNISKAPYDAERLQYGDEPQGPTMSELRNGTAGNSPDTSAQETTSRLEPSAWERYQNLAGWILPVWLTPLGFLSLHGMFLTFLVGAALELRARG